MKKQNAKLYGDPRKRVLKTKKLITEPEQSSRCYKTAMNDCAVLEAMYQGNAAKPPVKDGDVPPVVVFTPAQLAAMIRQSMSKMLMDTRHVFWNQIQSFRLNMQPEEGDAVPPSSPEELLKMIRGMPAVSRIVARRCLAAEIQAKHAKVELTFVQKQMLDLLRCYDCSVWPTKTQKQCQAVLGKMMQTIRDFERLATIEKTPLILLDSRLVCKSILENPEEFEKLLSVPSAAA